MAEPKRSPAENLPWMPLATVMAGLLAGGWLLFQPLSSSRPNIAWSGEAGEMSMQHVDARLWQDPLEAVPIHHQSGSSYEAKDHYIGAIRKRLVEGLTGDNRALILAVMVNGSGYAEKIERRLRDRVAVENALDRARYSPEDAEHLGSFTIPWMRYAKDGLKFESNPSDLQIGWKRGDCDSAWSDSEDRTWLTVPFEFHNPDAVDLGEPKRYNKILVLWLRQDFFDDAPLSRLAELFSWFQEKDGNVCGTVKVLGPNDSDSLLQMVKEAQAAQLAGQSPNSDKEKETAWNQVQEILNGISMFAFRPSAADQILLRDDSVKDGSVKALIEQVCSGLKFFRTTATDDALLKELIHELLRRHINPYPHSQDEHECIPVLGCSDATVPGLDAVAIISEQDTLFARALPATFNLLLHNSRRPPRNVVMLSYLRGIDGRTPLRRDSSEDSFSNRAPSSEPAADANKPAKPRGASEVPEGTDQSDYIRRLAKHVGELDAFQRVQSSNRQGIEAVGVLGSDIYDKLEILHALRSHVRARVFFTTGLDARFYHSAELSATRNLVVVSPFGLCLDHYYQGTVAPFRDSNQTAAFAAALCALGIMEADKVDFNTQLRVFEVGKYGPIDLSVDNKRELKEYAAGASAPWSDIHPARHDLRDWWKQGGHIDWRGLAYRLLGTLLLIGSIILARYSIWSDPVHNSKLVRSTTAAKIKPTALWKRLMQDSILVRSTTAAILVFVPAVILILAPFYYIQRLEGEPFNLFGGASMWPTEAIRLFVILLAIHFVFKSLSLLKDNETEIKPAFGLDNVEPARPSGWDWLFWRPKTNGSGPKIKELWGEYCFRSSRTSRMIWTMIWSVICLSITFCFMLVSREAISPVRGNLISWLDYRIVFWMVVPACTFLTFFVVHATLLDARFTCFLSQGKTVWPEDVLKMHQRDSSPRAQPTDFTREYLDILLIAQRTRAVTRLIYYPLIIISLLIICRLPVFDAFDWPPYLVASFCFYVAISGGCVFILRRVAEHARKAALGRLQEELRKARTGGPKVRRKAIEETVQQVETMNVGIFAPISRQPVIGALLLPSGSAGIWALLQYAR